MNVRRKKKRRQNISEGKNNFKNYKHINQILTRQAISLNFPAEKRKLRIDKRGRGDDNLFPRPGRRENLTPLINNKNNF